MVGRRLEGGFRCVQSDQKDSTYREFVERVTRHETHETVTGTYRAKRRNLLDAFFIINSSRAGATLLAEPEHPAGSTQISSSTQIIHTK